MHGSVPPARCRSRARPVLVAPGGPAYLVVGVTVPYRDASGQEETRLVTTCVPRGSDAKFGKACGVLLLERGVRPSRRKGARYQRIG